METIIGLGVLLAICIITIRMVSKREEEAIKDEVKADTEGATKVAPVPPSIAVVEGVTPTMAKIETAIVEEAKEAAAELVKKVEEVPAAIVEEVKKEAEVVVEEVKEEVVKVAKKAKAKAKAIEEVVKAKEEKLAAAVKKTRAKAKK